MRIIKQKFSKCKHQGFCLFTAGINVHFYWSIHKLMTQIIKIWNWNTLTASRVSQKHIWPCWPQCKQHVCGWMHSYSHKRPTLSLLTYFLNISDCDAEMCKSAMKNTIASLVWRQISKTHNILSRILKSWPEQKKKCLFLYKARYTVWIIAIIWAYMHSGLMNSQSFLNIPKKFGNCQL